jgi:hypothetical protein
MTIKLTEAQLTTNARVINNEHDQVVDASQSAFQHAITAGAKLTECKNGLPHGEWQAWLKKACPNISYETAALYMRLAEHEPELEEAVKENSNLQRVTDLSIRGADKLLRELKKDKGLTEEEKAAKKAERDAEQAKKKAERDAKKAERDVQEVHWLQW